MSQTVSILLLHLPMVGWRAIHANTCTHRSIGCRLYFSLLPKHRYGKKLDTSRPPQGLELVHIRMPPVSQYGEAVLPHGATDFQLTGVDVHVAMCKSDVFIAAHTASNEMDQLVCAGLDVGAVSQAVAEVSEHGSHARRIN
jgi:hypothetical protein